MANIVLANRGDNPAQTVGKNWPDNFVRRQEKLCMKYGRRKGYQRDKCEDPVIIKGWFDLVLNMKAKYGILDEDMYNFDETGFQMGIITNTKVVTRADRNGRPKAIQPGNREWVTVVHGINSQGWYIPPLIILAGQLHLAHWYKDSPLPPDWIIAVSENGWTDDEIGYEWIQHFHKSTISRTKGPYRLLILDGHGSHHTARFEEYCKENNIKTLCMPAHSSHVLQPLDVGCFNPLKLAYGNEIEKKMRLGVNHITKDEFLFVYYPAHIAAITKKTICSGFRASGLVPHDPDRVLSELNPIVKTPSPVSSHSSKWEPKTPGSRVRDIKRQLRLIEDRRCRTKASNSPSNVAMAQLLKGYEKAVHERAILMAGNKALRAENAHQKRKRAQRRTKVAEGGTITIQEAQDILFQGEVDVQLRKESASNAASVAYKPASTSPTKV